MPRPCSLGGAECQTPHLATQTTKGRHRRDDREVQIRPSSPYESSHPQGQTGRPPLVYISTGSRSYSTINILLDAVADSLTNTQNIVISRSRAHARETIETYRTISYDTIHTIQYHTNLPDSHRKPSPEGLRNARFFRQSCLSKPSLLSPFLC